MTGGAATSVDITDYLAGRMLLFFGAVLALSFLLLMIVFRSLLVPLKAVLMNLLSIGAAYGVVVAVFQWGWGGELSASKAGPINPFIPMMLFAVVFGLSMDYEVFLLSRIREEYVRTGDANTSVADGVASTARVITAAAAIMVVVFASFTLEEMREHQDLRSRARPRRLPRCNPRPHGGRPGHHGAPRRPQLVDPEVVRPNPAAPGHRAHPAGRCRRGWATDTCWSRAGFRRAPAPASRIEGLTHGDDRSCVSRPVRHRPPGRAPQPAHVGLPPDPRRPDPRPDRRHRRSGVLERRPPPHRTRRAASSTARSMALGDRHVTLPVRGAHVTGC